MYVFLHISTPVPIVTTFIHKFAFIFSTFVNFLCKFSPLWSTSVTFLVINVVTYFCHVWTPLTNVLHTIYGVLSHFFLLLHIFAQIFASYFHFWPISITFQHILELVIICSAFAICACFSSLFPPLPIFTTFHDFPHLYPLLIHLASPLNIVCKFCYFSQFFIIISHFWEFFTTFSNCHHFLALIVCMGYFSII